MIESAKQKTEAFNSQLAAIETTIDDLEYQIRCAKAQATKIKLPDVGEEMELASRQHKTAMADLTLAIKHWLAAPEQMADAPLLTAAASRCALNGSADECVESVGKRAIQLMVLNMLIQPSLRVCDRERWLNAGTAADIEAAMVRHCREAGIAPEVISRIDAIREFKSFAAASRMHCVSRLRKLGGV